VFRALHRPNLVSWTRRRSSPGSPRTPCTATRSRPSQPCAERAPRHRALRREQPRGHVLRVRSCV
jgi:hypothetical protein